MVTEVTSSGNIATVRVRCGQVLPTRTKNEKNGDYTAWYSRVTCPACLAFYDKSDDSTT